MTSQRQEKFARLLQRDLATIFSRETSSLFGNSFITVSKVAVSPDLGYAKVYLSLYNAKNKIELMQKIEARAWEIRKMLASKLRNQVKKIPELTFYEDDTLDYINRMDDVFDSLNDKETED